MAKETRTEAAERELLEAIYVAAGSLAIIWGEGKGDPIKTAERLIAQRRFELDDLQRAIYELGTEQAIEERFGAQWTNS